jgi:hypothetical protein
LSANADIDFDVRTGKLMMIDYSNSLLTRANPDGSSKVFVSASGTFIAYADVTAPSISSIARLAPASVNVGEGGTAQFRVTFSEPVLGVDAADFELGGTPTGSISVSPVSLNTVYDIVVSDISGIGTLDLNLANSHDVTDFGGNAAGGAIGAEETYTVITVPDPTISSFDPLSGAEGTTVTITGTNFSITPGDNVVKFNDVPSVVTASTVTSISTTVPATVPVGAAEITVTVNGRTATGATMFTVLCTPPPKPTIATDGGLLTSSSDSDNQWLRNGSEIAGATSKTFTPTDPGSYTVKVTSEGCSTESDPTTIVGAEEFVSSGVTIFPNPARSLVRVEVNASASNVTAELYTVTGERKETVPLKVMHGRAAGELYVADYPAGIYVMKIATDRRVIMKKLYLVSSGR